MLGKGSRHAEQCLAERFVGADYGIERDLSRELPDSWASSTRCSFLSIKKRIPKRSAHHILGLKSVPRVGLFAH